CFFLYFFFSSRRRHTRSKRDWSSDVCSSDLPGMLVSRMFRYNWIWRARSGGGYCIWWCGPMGEISNPLCTEYLRKRSLGECPGQIGRATCRERGERRVDNAGGRETTHETRRS